MGVDPYLLGEPAFYEAVKEALKGLIPGGESFEADIQNAVKDLGTILNPPVTQAADGPIGPTDHVTLGDAAAGVRTLTLPVLATVTGRVFFIQKLDGSGNAVIVDGDGAETINGAANQSLAAQFDGITVFAGPTEWIVLSRT